MIQFKPTGTPVLDIEPNLERGDAKTNKRAGEWVARYSATQPPEP